jgi:hypothetical protein
MANNTLKYLAVDPVLRLEKQREWNRPRVWPVVLVAAMLGAIVVPAVAMHRRRERSAAR